MAEVDEAILKIRTQLDHAKARRALGQYVDPMWHAKAQCALRTSSSLACVASGSHIVR
jgi:hypothetical protein